ncbi:MAG: carboxypeptidase-like regulatory domain-containing protein [Planctomycetota bacterium]
MLAQRAVFGLLLITAATVLVVWLTDTGAPGTQRERASPQAERVETVSGPTEGSRPADDPLPTLTGSTRPRQVWPLRGRVVDQTTGKPVDDALLVLVSGNEAEGVDVRQCRSHADGSFEVEDLPVGTWHLQTWHADFQALRAPDGSFGFGPIVHSETADSGPPHLELQLVPGVRLDLVARDDAGRPLSGARVWADGPEASVFAIGALLARPESEMTPSQLQTRAGLAPSVQGVRGFVLFPGQGTAFPVDLDEEGRASLSCFPEVLAAGDLRIAAETESARSNWLPVVGTGPWSIELEASRLATVSGRATYEDGRPAPDVQVTLEPKKGRSRTYRALWVSTDVDGRFAVTGVAGRTSWLTAWYYRPRQYLLSQDIEALSPGDVREGVTLIVPERHMLRARVRAPDGSPLAGELLGVRRDDDPGDGSQAALYSRTDEQGSLQIQVVGDGPWQVFRRLPDGPQPVARGIKLPGPEVEIVTEAIDHVGFDVSLVDRDGTRVPSFHVEVLGSTAYILVDAIDPRRTFESVGGIAQVQAYSPLPVDVRLVRSRGSGWSRSKIYTIDSSPTDGPLVLTWRAENELEGRVVDAQGRPVAGARVEAAAGADEPPRWQATTDDRGNFVMEINGGFPSSTWVRVLAPQGMFAPAPVVWNAAQGPIELRLMPATWLKGRIRLPPGLAFDPGEAIQLRWAANAELGIPAGHLRLPIEADGSFASNSVPPGVDMTWTYDGVSLLVHGLAFVASPAGARGGQRLDLVAAPTRTLRGRVISEAGVQGLHVSARAPAEEQGGARALVESDGTFELMGVPPSQVVVRVEDATTGGLALLEQVLPPHVTDVTLSLPSVDWLEVTTNPPSERAMLSVRLSGSSQILGYQFGRSSPYRLRLRTDVAYDISAEVDDLDSTSPRLGHPETTHLGSVASVRGGERVEVVLHAGVTLGGALARGSRQPIGPLVARSGREVFPLKIDALGHLQARVLPGSYDIFERRDDGVERMVASAVEAPIADWILELH